MPQKQPLVTLVTGANRGIGLEHVRQALAAGEQVIATCRDVQASGALAELQAAYPRMLDIVPLEAGDGASVEALARRLQARRIDRLINNAGIMGEQWGESPSRQMPGTMDYALWEEMLRINLLGPFRITDALLPNLCLSDAPLVVMMGSDLGSVAQNTMGGMHAYRSSKAALNMVMRGLACDLKADGITLVSMAPGWVRTDLGGDAAPWAVDDSVRLQREVLAGLGPQDSGRFVNLKGETVPW